jgi:hypothetical protein
MAPKEEKENLQVIELLESFREIPPRNPRTAEQGKARFLAQAKLMQEAVSPNAFQRLNIWITETFLRYRKERSPMLVSISSIILALAVVLGGGGITAFAAQGSLPNDVLYPIKLYLEDGRYGLTDDPVTQIELQTKFANNRIDEITDLTLQGDVVPNRVFTRLRFNLKTMLQIAAGLDEETTNPALLQIQQNLRTQEQLMEQLGQPEELDPTMEQLRTMLHEQHRIIQDGLEEPFQFQQMYRHGESESPGSPPDNKEAEDKQNGECTELENCIPAEDGTGPGPGPGGNQEPGGEGPGSGNSGDNGNQGESKPADNSGSGKGGETGGKNSGSGN